MESLSKAFQRLKKSCHEMCAPDQSCVQYWLLPERAPEWYRKIVLGTGSSDVHVRSAPRDSLPLLGGSDRKKAHVEAQRRLFKSMSNPIYILSYDYCYI